MQTIEPSPILASKCNCSSLHCIAVQSFCFDYKTFSKTYISIFHAPTIPIVSEVFHDIATLECNYGLVFNFDVEITVMWFDYPPNTYLK